MTEMNDYNPATGTFGDYNPNATPTEEEIAKAISHPVLTHLNAKVENLQSQLTASQDSVMRLRDKYRTAEYKLEAVLKEFLDDEVLDLDQAKSIADIFDSITLTKQIEIAYTITASVTVEVPYGADSDDVANEVYCDRVDFSTYNSDYEVLESDYDVEDWNVR